jgi:hypothetical protein
MLTDWRVADSAAIFRTLLITCIETSAQSMPKDVAARTEIYAIPSLTISDPQFLIGDADGKQVTVAGEFRIAEGSGKLPVAGRAASAPAWIRGCATQRDGDFDLRHRRFQRPRADGGRARPISPACRKPGAMWC